MILENFSFNCMYLKIRYLEIRMRIYLRVKFLKVALENSIKLFFADEYLYILRVKVIIINRKSEILLC